jgi:energy-coupling factor transport system permease protein
MTLSLYIDRDGSVQRLHPVTKLFGMLGLFTATFVTQDFASVVPLALLVIGIAAAARAFGNFRRMRALLLLVFLMTFAIWSLFYPEGQPIFTAGPVRVSREGIGFAAGIAVQLVTFLAIGILFLSTTKIEEFAYALHRVGLPHKLAFTITLTFRLVPVFLESATSVVQAQRCRGFDFDRGGPLQRLKRYVPILVPVFVGALRRADGMAIALDSRGFQSAGRRTSFAPYVFRGIDVVALLAVAGVTAGYGWLWMEGAKLV